MVRSLFSEAGSLTASRIWLRVRVLPGLWLKNASARLSSRVNLTIEPSAARAVEKSGSNRNSRSLACYVIR